MAQTQGIAPLVSELPPYSKQVASNIVIHFAQRDVEFQFAKPVNNVYDFTVNYSGASPVNFTIAANGIITDTATGTTWKGNSWKTFVNAKFNLNL